MAYTGGNSGYVRRLGKIPSSGGGVPTEPVAGYSVWFSADDTGNVWQDVAKTTPAADGQPVRAWVSSRGTVNYETAQASGSTFPAYSVGPPAIVTSTPTRDGAFRKLTGGVITDGVISPGGAAFTVFAVAKWTAANDTSAVGTNADFYVEQRNQPGHIEMAMYDGAGHIPALAGDYSGDLVIVTSMLSGGSGYIGVNDTRTASLGSGTANAFHDSPLELMGSLGSRYLNGALAEVIIYPTVLSEDNRKLTEQYLANKYGITLPY